MTAAARSILVYSIYAFTHAYSDGGLFGVYAGTGAEEAAELMPTLCGEIRRLSQGLTAIEIERARAQLKAGLLMSLEGTTARCEQQANHMLVFGRPLDLGELVAQIDAVDAAAVARHRPDRAEREIYPARRAACRLRARACRLKSSVCRGFSASSRRPFASTAKPWCCARPTGATGCNGRSFGKPRAIS